jgi:hypothetical protein
MATLKKLAYSYAKKLGKGTDMGFIRMTEFDILSLVATLARQEYEKTGKFPNELITEVSCLEMIQVDAAECCDVELGCKVLKTAYKIPSTISIKDQINFISVTGVDKKTKYTYINPARIGYTDSKFGPFEYYSLLNNYIYIFDNIEIEKINVVAAFVDIRELSAIKDCFGNSCFSESSEVRIPDHYVHYIKKMLKQELVKETNSPEVEISYDK